MLQSLTCQRNKKTGYFVATVFKCNVLPSLRPSSSQALYVSLFKLLKELFIICDPGLLDVKLKK